MLAVEQTTPRVSAWAEQIQQLDEWNERAQKTLDTIQAMHGAALALAKESQQLVDQVAAALNMKKAFRMELMMGSTTAHSLQPEMLDLGAIWNELYSGHLRQANVLMPGMYFPFPSRPGLTHVPTPPSPPRVEVLPSITTVRVRHLLLC